MICEQVSIVIPCFNSGLTLVQAVDSAKAQSWPSLEIIVIDDGSTDLYTLNVLNSLDGIILIRQVNKGLAAARNTGFKSSSSKYILPLDSDDWLHPNAVEYLMSCLCTKGDFSFVYSHIRLEGEASGVLIKPFNAFEQLFLNQIPYAMLLPYSAWLNAGGYDETMLYGYEDWEFNIRLIVNGYHGYCVESPLFHYRVSQYGMLISCSNRIHAELWESIQKKHAQLYRPSRLMSFWLEWRRYPSSYPLISYFAWYLLHRLIPKRLFSTLFCMMRKNSQSLRLTRMYSTN